MAHLKMAEQLKEHSVAFACHFSLGTQSANHNHSCSECINVCTVWAFGSSEEVWLSSNNKKNQQLIPCTSFTLTSLVQVHKPGEGHQQGGVAGWSLCCGGWMLLRFDRLQADAIHLKTHTHTQFQASLCCVFSTTLVLWDCSSCSTFSRKKAE